MTASNRYALIVFGWVLPFLLCAGPRDFTTLVYNSDRDFDGIFIYTVTQDSDGFLWVGSDDGLYRFDGEQMLNLNANDSTVDNLVTAAVAGPDGLYLGFFAGGIHRVRSGKIEPVLEASELPSRVNQIRLIGSDIWALTQNKGLVILQNGRKIKIPLKELEGVICRDFWVVRDELFVGTNEGLFRYGIQGDERLQFEGVVPGTINHDVNTLLQDDRLKDVLWVGTDEGLFYLERGVGWQSVAVLTDQIQVSALAKDQLNTLWVGSKNKGLVQIELEPRTRALQINSITRFNRSTGFESNQINELYVDRENEVWVGTFGHGLVQLNRAYFHHYELYNTIQLSGVHSMSRLRAEELLLGTDQGLVRVFSEPLKDSLIFERLAFSEGFSFHALLVTEDKIWAGTEKNGLYTIDLASRKMKPVRLLKDNPVENQLIRDIQQDRNGNIWVAAAANGVFELNESGEVLRHFNTKTGFYHNDIVTICPDRYGNVWFGSHATGLALLTKAGELKLLSRDEIFPSFDINTITQHLDGNVWIATQGAGLYEFDGEVFRQYTRKKGLLSNYCNSVMIDDIGQIWIGHRLGITLIQPEYDIIRTFNHPNELGETESELNSVCKDAKGNVYFGNPYGITKVNLPYFNFKIEELQTQVKSIRLFFEETDIYQFAANEELTEVIPSQLTFPHDQNHLTFDYIAIKLRNPQAVRYQFKLKGFDKHWSPVTNNTQATYTNLSPGEYTFMVRQSEHEGYWTDDYTSLKVEIRPPYWEMWWFYLLQISIILLLVYITYFLSARLRSEFAVRLMVYICIFIAFDYIHTELEPYLEEFSGETPIFQVAVNLLLALCLLPIEIRMTRYMKKRREQAALAADRKSQPDQQPE
ncbi:ligand-binding sensor domain-containing protein [Marinoscillum furvescens]|uniref:Ligand-binding sensor domain-containing protein n=1 Tax=Marinoscillum furvescens DSM 4134 TaxID=1122208 RepID=A0A3D9L1B9_MARFU|nr:two-component regulator propeller domain-containing protein [Marinoscillum furvescens]RED97090.1 ligand-binding sensor domain-containing protein [Marinoscillum furvescens DSM 4134]